MSIFLPPSKLILFFHPLRIGLGGYVLPPPLPPPVALPGPVLVHPPGLDVVVIVKILHEPISLAHPSSLTTSSTGWESCRVPTYNLKIYNIMLAGKSIHIKDPFQNLGFKKTWNNFR